MAIRDGFVYPIADGDQLNDGYFNSLNVHTAGYSYATEITHTGDTNYYNDNTEGQMKLTVASIDESILIGINFECEFDQDTAGTGSIRIRIVDSSGTEYVREAILNETNSTTTVMVSATDAPLFNASNSSYNLYGVNVNPCKQIDTTLTIYIDIKTSDGSTGVVKIKNQILRISYSRAGVAD